ncbi:MAG: hypothetical protein VX001_04065 [Planctomycetota bacterium]|nr:hypothetical protein [Planctomycetota bacterium]
MRWFPNAKMSSFSLPLLAVVLAWCSGCGSDASPPVDSDAKADPEALRAASVFLDTGKYDEAQAIVVRALEVAPRDPNVVALRAEISLARWKRDRVSGKAQMAIDGFLRAAELSEDPVSRAAYQRNAAVVMSELGLTKQAVATLRAARTAVPEDLQTALFLAQVLSSSPDADQEEIRSLYESVLALDGEAYPAEVGLAMLDLQAGFFMPARDRIASLRASRPNDRDLRLLHARIERLSGRPSVAVGLLSVVSESDRVASNMTFEYAAALLATGRWLDAELAFDFHSASNPEDPQLLDWAQALHGLAIGEARRNPAAQTSADRWAGRVARQRGGA